MASRKCIMKTECYAQKGSCLKCLLFNLGWTILNITPMKGKKVLTVCILAGSKVFLQMPRKKKKLPFGCSKRRS